MDHQLRAEYTAAPADEGGPGGPERSIRSWHMVREGEQTQAMCGHDLDPEAARRPDSDWGRTPEPMCHTCGALYLREVP